VDRRAEQGRATREHLVAVATRLFAEHGYEGTSIEAVLEEAGVSRGSLYHHFKSKDALFDEVLEAVETRIGEETLAAIVAETDPADPDPVVALRAGSRAWIRLAGDPVVRRILLVDAPAVIGWDRWREIEEQHALGGVKLTMQAAAERGLVRPEMVDLFAHMLLAGVNEIALVLARSPDDPDARRAAEAAVDDFVARLLGG